LQRLAVLFLDLVKDMIFLGIVSRNLRHLLTYTSFRYLLQSCANLSYVLEFVWQTLLFREFSDLDFVAGILLVGI